MSATQPTTSGQYRDIEDELANRVLSDISEEDAEDMRTDVMRLASTSRDAIEAAARRAIAAGTRQGHIVFLDDLRDERDKTPTRTSTQNQQQTSNGGAKPQTSQISSNKDHDGSIVVKQALHQIHIIKPPPEPTSHERQGPSQATDPSKPQSGLNVQRQPRPAGKSPVRRYAKEAVMEVVIATKRGTEHRLESPERADDLDDLHRLPSATAAKPTAHRNDFDDLIADVSRVRSDLAARRKEIVDEREKYMADFGGADLLDYDEYDWESEYQNGPETYLMSTKNARLSARVRDYRRELWGEGAPAARAGILGHRNADITIRERRRYTDVVKEDPRLQKSLSVLDNQLNEKTAGAIRRVRSDVNLVPQTFVNTYKKDGAYAPVFQMRIKEQTFVAHSSATVSCMILAQPKADVQWYHNDTLVVEDARHRLTVDGTRYTLTINPTLSFDSGAIRCEASNSMGTASCSARLKAGDLPDRPSRPDISLASDSELFITWEPPISLSSSNNDILAYKLEYRRAGDTDFACPWLLISDTIDEEAIVLRHLEPQGIYQFRIIARNCFGWGDPSLASRIIRTHPKGAPKLMIDTLRQEHRLCIVTIPQSSKRGVGHILSGIAEECEDELVEQDLDEMALTQPPNSTTTSQAQDSLPLSMRSNLTIGLNCIDDPLTRYDLHEEICRGRFSVVRHAVDKGSESGSLHCVVKVILTTGDRANHAINEYEALRDVRHENVVSLLNAYTFDGYMFLIMERLFEPLFDRFCAIDYYSEYQVAKACVQILAGIQWIHFQGLLHLDIQPDNIMMSTKRTAHIKLIDMGSAVAIAPESGLPCRGYQPPDVEYAAPECLNNVPVTPLADVWSFGMVAFVLMSGFHPFVCDETDTAEDIERATINDKLDLDLIYANASQDALRLVTWALKKQPQRRMSVDEGLQHKWLSGTDAMARRLECIKFSSNRLRKYTMQYRQSRRQRQCLEPRLLQKYGAPVLTNGQNHDAMMEKFERMCNH